MKAMTPHHSSTIMVSKHTSIKEPEVIEPADSIIALQERAIAQMEAALKRLDKYLVTNESNTVELPLCHALVRSVELY